MHTHALPFRLHARIPRTQRNHARASPVVPVFCPVLLPSLLFASALPAQDFSHPDTEPAPQAALIQKANDALAAGDFRAALAVLTNLNVQSPKDPQILYDLGMTLEALAPDSPNPPLVQPIHRDARELRPPRPACAHPRILLPPGHRGRPSLPRGARRARPAAGPHQPAGRSPHPARSRHHSPRRRPSAQSSRLPRPSPPRL